MKKYPELVDFEPTTLDNRIPFFFKCCDCGLVHKMIVYTSRLPRKEEIVFVIARDTRKTAAARREMKKRKDGIFQKKHP